jgi:hypothetical protein
MIAPSEVPHAGPCHQGFGIQNLRLGLSKSMAFQRNEIQIGPGHEQGRMLEESTLPVFRWLVTPATDFWQNWVHSQMEVPPKPTGLPENTQLKLTLLADISNILYPIPSPYPHSAPGTFGCPSISDLLALPKKPQRGPARGLLHRFHPQELTNPDSWKCCKAPSQSSRSSQGFSISNGTPENYPNKY